MDRAISGLFTPVRKFEDCPECETYSDHRRHKQNWSYTAKNRLIYSSFMKIPLGPYLVEFSHQLDQLQLINNYMKLVTSAGYGKVPRITAQAILSENLSFRQMNAICQWINTTSHPNIIGPEQNLNNQLIQSEPVPLPVQTVQLQLPFQQFQLPQTPSYPIQQLQVSQTPNIPSFQNFQ